MRANRHRAEPEGMVSGGVQEVVGIDRKAHRSDIPATQITHKLFH
jgi:hypothetical protein